MVAKIIGDKIAEARKKNNISQAQLAERLFISPQAVGKWERGESMPDIITFGRLAEILNVDLNYFSENFQSVTADTVAITNLETQNLVKPLEKQKEKPLWDMSQGNWVDADFSGLNNLGEKFSSSNIQRCTFVGSDLKKLLLKNNNIDNCNFTDSDISNGHIKYSNVAKSQFINCNLKDSEFSACSIDKCDFTGTDFTGVTIKSCSFSKNTVIGALWNRTSFKTTGFDDVTFVGYFENCFFEECGFNKVIFQNVTLVNTFFKNNNKLNRVQFIDCKVDTLTYAFLKNGKADMTGITLLNINPQ